MRSFIGVLFLAAAGLLATSPAHGTASASVTVNGTTRTLSQTGFLFEQIGAVGVNLAPGQSSDFTFNYSISLQDSGLPVAFDQQAVGCSSIFPSTCNDAYTGFEYAKAYLIVLQEDPRVGHNPAVVEQGVNGSVTLATHGDSFAESLTQAGALQGHIGSSRRTGGEHLHEHLPDFHRSLGPRQPDTGACGGSSDDDGAWAARGRCASLEGRCPRDGRPHPPQQ